MQISYNQEQSTVVYPRLSRYTQLGEIRVLTLVVAGSHDFICSPLHAHRLHLGIAGSKLILIEKAGHFPWFEQPDPFFSKVKEGLAAVQ
ncbi:MAG: hypothetical protein V7K30_00515 [Nostoc sp.]